MKTVISATENNIDSAFDKRFGRAAWFCVFDEENGKIDFLKNNYAEASNGAGTKVASMMVELGIKKVISGHFGPKAKEILDKFNIQMVLIEEETSISKIITKLKNDI